MAPAASSSPAAKQVAELAGEGFAYMRMHVNNKNTAPQHSSCCVHTSPHTPAALQMHGEQLWLFGSQQTREV